MKNPKKNGTRYLALIEAGKYTVTQRWEIIHWGVPSVLSDIVQKECWCNQINFGLKINKIISFMELDKATELMSVKDAEQS